MVETFPVLTPVAGSGRAQAKVRSTIQRLGSATKPVVLIRSLDDLDVDARQ